MSNPMSFEGTQWAMVGTSQGQEVWVHAEGYVNLYNAATDEVTELDAMPTLDGALALIESALLTLDSTYPYPMDADNLRIEYETLLDIPPMSARNVPVEVMARRMLAELA